MSDGWYPSQASGQPAQAADQRRTLASYSLAPSATPSTRIARHLSSLTLGPAAGSFHQPGFYPETYSQTPPLGNPPPYSVYDQNSHRQPADQHLQHHWHGSQPGIQHHTSAPSAPIPYNPHGSHNSHNYSSSSSLAHALYQPQPHAHHPSHVAQAHQQAAPTHAPAPYTSSLAGALGPYPIAQPPPPRRYHATESMGFLDTTIMRASQSSQSSQTSQPLSQTQINSQTLPGTQATVVAPLGSPAKVLSTRLTGDLDAMQLVSNDTPPVRGRVVPSSGSPQKRTAHHQIRSVDEMQLVPDDIPSPQQQPPPRMLPLAAASSSAVQLPQNRMRADQVQHMPDSTSSARARILSESAASSNNTTPSRLPFQAAPRFDPRVSQESYSPDPLAINSGTVTPRKRKPTDLLESPSIKRPQSSVLSPTKKDMPQSFNTPPSQRFQTMPTSSTKRMSHVELPRLPNNWFTPTKTDGGTPASQDLGGYGSVSPQKGYNVPESAMRSGRKTGDRDDRVPLDKFIEFAQGIATAEDELPPEGDPGATMWSDLTSDWQRPMLSPGAVKKLIKLVSKVARPTKRDRLVGVRDGLGSPRRGGALAGLAEAESGLLSRMLKLLERSVQAGEYVDPFAGPPSGTGYDFGAVSMSPSKEKKSPVKSKKGKGKSPAGAEDDEDTDKGANGKPEITQADYEKLDRALDAAREAIIAADCCVALLAADKLPKQMYSEELITSCLSTAKNLLDKVIYPFVEANSDVHGQSSLILIQTATSPAQAFQARRMIIGEIFLALSSLFPRIDSLISRTHVAMSDKIIIAAVYIAIGPFFVVEFGTEGGKAGKEKAASASFVMQALGGSVALRGLRLTALALIRTIFANHEDQRSWIIEEILTSLIKLPDLKQKAGQFRLRDGHSIHTVSALLLQLVQTSAHDVRIEARKLALSRQQSMVMRHDSAPDVQEALLSDRDREEIQLYTNGLDSATKAAKTIVAFLTQRAGKGKITKNTNEAEYRAIFDNLISDLLAVLFWPEWPAASLLMDIICKYMVNSLDDVKSHSASNDNNAAKASALDHLGTIAARLRTSLLKFSVAGKKEDEEEQLRPLDDVVAKLDLSMLERLITVHHDVMNHLATRATEDQAYDSAQELTAASWGHEIAMFLPRCDSILRSIVEQGSGTKEEEVEVRKIGQELKSAMHGVWKGASNDVFNVSTEEVVARVDRLAEEIGTIQNLKNAFDPILSVILVALDSPAVFMRSKALRALGQIIGSDQQILRNTKVRTAIVSHLLDNSPAVRDAAVELIGKYVLLSSEIASDYYQRIAERIADTGLGVRKRVIKLLKSLYPLSDSLARQADISARLVLRQMDEDDTVKDLATKTVEELWFGDADLAQKIKSPQEQRAALIMKANVIMQVTGAFGERHTALEDMLHRIVNDREGKDKDMSQLKSRYAALCDVLIEGLVDPQEFTGFSTVSCIKTIYLFTTGDPSVITSATASTLLPYLKNPSSAEEHLIADYLLKIFRASLPLMPRTAAKFGAELQLTLQPMIVKPSGTGGLSSLQEAVACMCAVVKHLTHDYNRLVNLLKSCNAKMQDFIKRPTVGLSAPHLKALSILIIIVSLLTEHCDFDKLRTETPAIAGDLNAVSKDSISMHVYKCLLTLYNNFSSDVSMRGRFLQCLGFLFRAYPTLMTTELSATLMDGILASPEDDLRARLLKIIQDFLISESQKHSAREKEAATKATGSSVNMDKLVGNTHDFAESGVASAIVQRYLQSILDAALAKNAQIQSSALDILSFTIKQGLAHPLQCLPVIVALETSPAATTSAKASALHAVLHTKHASLVNMRYIECARTSFAYQQTIHDGAPVQGYRSEPVPTALLHPWYALVREKRATRQDFLKALVRAFDVDVSALSSSQDNIDFARYMAENLAVLDYKTNEEVLTVIRHLTSVLSVSGTQLVEVISPSNLLKQLHDDPMSVMDVDSAATSPESLPIARTSVVVGICLLLRAHLKLLYTLSEDKCLKWQPGKKSALGDKPAVRRGDPIVSWDRLPFALQRFANAENVSDQYRRFLDLWAEDGVKEPVDEAE